MKLRALTIKKDGDLHVVMTLTKRSLCLISSYETVSHPRVRQRSLPTKASPTLLMAVNATFTNSKTYDLLGVNVHERSYYDFVVKMIAHEPHILV